VGGGAKAGGFLTRGDPVFGEASLTIRRVTHPRLL
jgi:hypothetical protein